MTAQPLEPAWAVEPDWCDDPFAGPPTPVGLLRAVDADAEAVEAEEAFLAGAGPQAQRAAAVAAAVERVARLEGMRRWVAAEQARAVAELTTLTRDPRVVVARSGVGFSAHEECVVSTGLALGLSTWWAGKRVDEAVHWTLRVPLAVAALDAGLLGEGGVRALLEETADLDPDDVEAVTREVLDRAGHDTVHGLPLGQRGSLGRWDPTEWQMLDPDARAPVVAKATTAAVRRWARLAALKLRDRRAAEAGLDPGSEAADLERERREQAREARTVESSPGKEGMAWLSIYAPEAEVLGVTKTLETDAWQLLSEAGGSGGDGATGEDPVRAQQVMADLAIDRLLGCPPRHSACPGGSGGSAAASEALPPAPHVRVGTVPRPIQLMVIIDGEAIAHAARLGPIERASLLDLVAMARGTPGGGVSVKVTERLECRGHPPGSAHGPYEVPAPLARAIKARDVTCRFPGCVVSATGCDLDHTTPYEDGGPTCECNLAAICRHHHRLKTHASGWTLRQLGDGVLEWTDPTGRSYRTRPAS